MRQRRPARDPGAGRLPGPPGPPGGRRFPAARVPAGLLAGLLAVAISACGGSPGATASPSAPAPGQGTTGGPASPAPAPSRAAGTPASCADRVLARMTLAQRVGQLFIVGLAGSVLDAATAQAIRAYHFGSVSFIATDTAGVAGVGAVTRAVQSLTSPQVTGGARFFVAANQEGGEIQALQGPGFARVPSALAQGMLPPAAVAGPGPDLGRRAAGRGRQPQLRAGHGRCPGRGHQPERTHRPADAGVRPHPGRGGRPRRRLHPGHDRGGRGHHRQALPRAGPGAGEHRLQRRRGQHGHHARPTPTCARSGPPSARACRW